VLPNAYENEFSGHCIHSVFPASALYVPAEHSTHGPPLGPLDPALQTHTLLVVPAMATADECGGQVSQFVVPVSALTVKVKHDTHGPPLAPLDPALHAQVKMFVAPTATENEFAGHSRHDEFPVSDLYVLV